MLAEAPTVFLDFDGVLSVGMSADFRHLPHFTEWLQAHPALQVVVTSDWRKYHDLEALRHKVLGSAIAERVVGVTPHNVWNEHSTDAEFMYPRQRQIIAWRRANKHKGAFVAIDDSAGLYAPGWPYLVLTDSTIGLTGEHLRQMLEILGLAPHDTSGVEATPDN